LEKDQTGEKDQTDPGFNVATARLLRREALRRAAEDLNTTSAPGLENVLERITAEVTAEAEEKRKRDDPMPRPAR
jgi:hypothetical protein